MGDIARCSINNGALLYKLFGVNAEILIDHAWGWEPVTLKDIKNYKPSSNSISTSQVLHEPYNYSKTKLIVEEMIELLSLDLVKKRLVTKQLVLTIGYDTLNINDHYIGDVTTDRYGRIIPKHATGRICLDHYTSSTDILMKNIINLYNRIVDKELLIRRINITANGVLNENITNNEIMHQQFDIFTDTEKLEKELKLKKEKENKERSLQRTMINLKDKYGKNTILKGMNLLEGGTTIDRNKQVGGHKA